MALQLPPKLNAVLRDPMLGARTAGRAPVVAFMSNQVPVELVHAARCFPLQLPTAPLAATPRADRLLPAHCDPQVRVALERLLDGAFAGVDLLVLPGSIDVLQRLYHTLRGLRCEVARCLPEVFHYDVVQASQSPSSEHNQARMLALRQRLEALAGQRTDDATLRASIDVYNGVRSRLEALSARRRQLPCLLEGAVAMDVFVASQRIWPEALCETLDHLLATPGEPSPGTRTLLIGSAHDTSALHRLISRAGGQVVGDHHWRGELLFGPPIDTRLPPLRALASHYHGDRVSSHTFPSNKYAQADAPTWDYPAQCEALSASGIPSLPLELQAYPPRTDVEATLRSFYDSVRRL